MKRYLILMVTVVLSTQSIAATYCNGKISAVYKWADMTTMSVQVTMADGTITNWINMPTRSDEAMALTALVANKAIQLYWSATDVIACSNGWLHNRRLEGFFVVAN